jgi:hypothetical protein
MVVMRHSCRGRGRPPAGRWRGGREGEEDLVEAGLAQRQLGHRDLGVGQALQHRRRQLGVADLGGDRAVADLGRGP